MSAPVILSAEPLATELPGVTAWRVLAASFHLELLERGDEGVLEQVLDLVWDWIGPELRTASLSVAEDREPARKQHLEYISAYASSLEAARADDPATQFEANNYAKFGRTDYSVDLSGATEDETASPFSLSFWSEIGTVSTVDTWLPAFTTLTLTVPESWPLVDFHDRVRAVAALLRLRWGAAGYGYSAVFRKIECNAARAIFAHARRHPGYDVGYHVRSVELLYQKLRTVSWLTWVGPALADELIRLRRPLATTPHVDVAPAGSGVVLRAGDAPARGDVNRLDVPLAYREADALVRPVRAHDPRGLVFLGPWTEAQVEEWLRRFERRVS